MNKTISITIEDAQEIIDEIRTTLLWEWDRHQDSFCSDGFSEEDGMRRMSPTLYRIAESLRAQIKEIE